MSTKKSSRTKSKETNVRTIALPPGSDDLYRVLRATNTEDPAPEDVEALREALREQPGLWRRVIDLARITEDQIIESAAKGNALLRESLRQGTDEVKEELGYADAPALERLLIEQVALSWLHHRETERYYVAFTNGRYRISEAEHWEKRVSASQRRYLRAVKTLARIRKMAGREVLQINIGGQHVNVAG